MRNTSIFLFLTHCLKSILFHRYERHKDRARDRNIQRAAPDKRTKLQRERERDISEKIALGIPAKAQQGDDTAFDQRLFNQSKGKGKLLVVHQIQKLEKSKAKLKSNKTQI